MLMFISHLLLLLEKNKRKIYAIKYKIKELCVWKNYGITLDCFLYFFKYEFHLRNSFLFVFSYCQQQTFIYVTYLLQNVKATHETLRISCYRRFSIYFNIKHLRLHPFFYIFKTRKIFIIHFLSFTVSVLWK